MTATVVRWRGCAAPPVLLLTALACLFGAAQRAAARDTAKPNIIFILADDMGYGDPHVLNPESKIATPHLDALAHAGMTFTNAHSPSAVCTPTRYGVLTGRYCWRSRLKRGVLNGYSKALIDPKRLTVAGLLARSGYHTAAIGKWHLGMDYAPGGGQDGKKRRGPQFDFTKPIANGPTARGFDTCLIIPASLDFPPYMYVKDDRAVEPPTARQAAQRFPRFLRAGPIGPNFRMEDCLDELTREATAYIRRRAKAGKPFFLYFALPAPHKPVWPHRRFQGRTRLGPYGDFVVQVDWTVGQVIEAVDAAGIRENTLVIFTSDNGSYMHRFDQTPQRQRGKTGKDHVSDPGTQGYLPKNHRANYIYRGTKADIWEAGHRVPFFVRWPKTIRAGGKNGEAICLTDFMATCAAIVGAKLGTGAAEDSFSLLPLMKGGTWPAPRAPVIHHSAGGMFAIREGKWKLVAGNGSGGRQNPRGKPFQRPYHLFDMEEDPIESKNLVEQYPEIAKRLEAALEKIRTSGRSVSRN